MGSISKILQKLNESEKHLLILNNSQAEKYILFANKKASALYVKLEHMGLSEDQQKEVKRERIDPYMIASIEKTGKTDSQGMDLYTMAVGTQDPQQIAQEKATVLIDKWKAESEVVEPNQ